MTPLRVDPVLLGLPPVEKKAPAPQKSAEPAKPEERSRAEVKTVDPAAVEAKPLSAESDAAPAVAEGKKKSAEAARPAKPAAADQIRPVPLRQSRLHLSWRHPCRHRRPHSRRPRCCSPAPRPREQEAASAASAPERLPPDPLRAATR